MQVPPKVGHSFHIVCHPTLKPSGDATNHRQVNKRHDKAGRENKDQRDRKHTHEFPRDTGPEQHGQEGA